MVFAGIAATVWVIERLFRLVMPLIQKKSGGNGSANSKDVARAKCIPPDVDIRLMSRQVDDLWQWHNVRGPDQVPVWYVPSKMGNALESLVEILREMRHSIGQLDADVKDVKAQHAHVIQYIERHENQ